jgi:hypothetical protein
MSPPTHSLSCLLFVLPPSSQPLPSLSCQASRRSRMRSAVAALRRVTSRRSVAASRLALRSVCAERGGSRLRLVLRRVRHSLRATAEARSEAGSRLRIHDPPNPNPGARGEVERHCGGQRLRRCFRRHVPAYGLHEQTPTSRHPRRPLRGQRDWAACPHPPMLGNHASHGFQSLEHSGGCLPNLGRPLTRTVQASEGR